MDIGELVKKVSQLGEKDALRRRILTNVTTVVTSQDPKERRKAPEKVKRDAAKLAY